MKELVHRIAEKEGKSLREVLKEMDMSTGTIYKSMGEEAKRKILEKAFEVLDPDEVLLEIFYDIRAIYGRIVRDILEVAGDETKEEILTKYNDIGIEKIPINSSSTLISKNIGMQSILAFGTTYLIPYGTIFNRQRHLLSTEVQTRKPYIIEAYR
ncbi:hypothetical protein [Saccharolobus caldissimus]|uniref:Uncharacterized protein n=1 Tax=Saccharolobus caldissimus TaxID=1702097 RepID=A0AAQ4CVQ7_9CREN|nr:hypothetical protein [Saccharolobus caldissimus]BDB99888.1 hypothetical protein SACC_29050 [Saccharolobus caldissimus]